jgi:hypothetical protein
MKGIKMLGKALVAGLAIASAGWVVGSADDDDDRGRFIRWAQNSTSKISGSANNQYVEECGTCHFAYQPGLLSAASWERILADLENHFGENAELDENDLRKFRNYLLDNAAGRSGDGLAHRVMLYQGRQQQLAPLRITDSAFFRHEHDEIPVGMVKENPDVRSFANCDACHTRAVAGSYDEHQVKIPGYGRWDD